MLKKLSYFIYAGVLISVILGLSVCITEAKEKEIYVMEVYVSGVPYWIDARDGLRKAAELLGVEARFAGPTTWNIGEQTADMDTYIAQGVDGIILCPTDSEAMIPAIDRAVEAGIPVATLGDDAPRSKRFVYVDTEQYRAGKIGGEYLVEILGEKDEVKVGISMGGAGQRAQELRVAGYKDVIAKYPNMKVVSIVEDKFDYAAGFQEVKSMLVAHPDVDAIVGTNATSGACIAGSLREAGYKPGEVKVVAFDKNEDVLNLVKEGWITGTVVQRTYWQGFLALHLVYWQKHGFLYPARMEWEKKGVPPVPNYVDTGIVIATKDNVESFYAKK